MQRIMNWGDIRPGDVWSVRSKTFISEANQLFSAGKWSHSGLVYSYDRLLLTIEPGAPGELRWTLESLVHVERQDLEVYHKQFDGGNMAVFRPEFSDKTRALALSAIGKYEGQKYPWIGTALLSVVLPLNRLLYRLGINRQIPTPLARFYMKCSHLVLKYLSGAALIQDSLREDQTVSWTLEVPDAFNFTPVDLVACCESDKYIAPSVQ